MKLQGKVAVVTGAGQGIGRAYARRLTQEGARVVVAELNETKGKAVAEECHAAGGEAVFVRTDVADEGSCQEMAATEWDQLMAVNVRGVWLASKAVVPQMQRQRSGRIVNISSAAIFMGRPNYLHYIASKGAVYAMTRSMARELGDFGITVNTITPGATYTEIPRGTVTPEQREAMLRMQCVHRPEEPGDLVGTVVFLASDDATFITGQTINVDGGMNFH